MWENKKQGMVGTHFKGNMLFGNPSLQDYIWGGGGHVFFVEIIQMAKIKAI